MVLLIIIPIKNGYVIGNINPTFSVTNPYHLESGEHVPVIFGSLLDQPTGRRVVHHGFKRRTIGIQRENWTSSEFLGWNDHIGWLLQVLPIWCWYNWFLYQQMLIRLPQCLKDLPSGTAPKPSATPRWTVGISVQNQLRTASPISEISFGWLITGFSAWYQVHTGYIKHHKTITFNDDGRH